MPRAQLAELYAYRLGVIDEARLEFGEGFNVITGETGAGKTLLVGALGLCLGADASASRYALTPETRTVAVFVREHDELVVSREANASGRLRSSLNGAPSSVEALRGLAEELIVMHGQHDSLTLRNRSEIVRIIDRYGAIDTSQLEELRRQLREALRLRLEFGGDREARQREIEFVAYQLDELEGAVLGAPEELADTLAELTRLTSLREGQAALAEVLGRLDGESDESVLSQFARALTRLPDGDVYGPARSSLRGALDEAREALRELASLSDPDALDGRRLVEFEARATQLQFIARKYGGTLATALATRDDLRLTVRRLASDADRLDGLDQEIQDLERGAATLAQRVKDERERAAHALTDAVERQFARVALANATLRVTVGGDDGSNADIVFAPNPGRSEGPLSALASGGELSRVLLAISLETADPDVVAVFDEIDAGLGGQVAQQIGECLSEVGRHQQVLAITHLASVAARADHHYVIDKMIDHGVTSTSVRAVTGEDRVREIARMLAGDDLTAESLALARQLLEIAMPDRVEVDFPR